MPFLDFQKKAQGFFQKVIDLQGFFEIYTLLQCLFLEMYKAPTIHYN